MMLTGRILVFYGYDSATLAFLVELLTDLCGKPNVEDRLPVREARPTRCTALACGLMNGTAMLH